MTTSSDAAALQLVLEELAIRAGVDIAQFFRRFGDRAEFANVLLQAFPELVGPYLQASALVSAQVYDELAPGLAFKAQPAPELPEDRLIGSARWALYAPGEGLPQNRLAGATARMVMDVSRQTTLENLAVEYNVPMTEIRDPGTRWARQARPNACGFCRMLATRGAVYRNRGVAYDEEAGVHRTVVAGRGASLTAGDRRRIAAGAESTENALARRERYVSAGRAAKQGKKVGDLRTGRLRGSQSHADRYHDNCFCVAVAVRPGQSYEPPDYAARWEDDYIAASRESRDPKDIARLMEGPTVDPIKKVDIEVFSSGSWVTKRVPADSAAARAYAKRKSS